MVEEELDIKTLSANVRVLASDVRDLLRALRGGDDPSKGLIVRVDRLEQFKSTSSKLLWILVGAAIAFGFDRLSRG